jgi:hypothetical protein
MAMRWVPAGDVPEAKPPSAFSAAAESLGFRFFTAIRLDDPDQPVVEQVWRDPSGALLIRGEHGGVEEINLLSVRADGAIARTIGLPAAARDMLPDQLGVPEGGLSDRLVLDADLVGLLAAHGDHLASFGGVPDLWPIDRVEDLQRTLWRTSSLVEARLLDAALRKWSRTLLVGGALGLLGGAALLFAVGGWAGTCGFVALAAPSALGTMLSARFAQGVLVPPREPPQRWEAPPEAPAP